ncbi:VOC family protein [Sorangium sp. So ce131]|uniref:VOC family protein n=1 Tax=Sorangium sp. So ce131 TaxID=3133282 RepID=UPI003F622F29
MTVSVTNHLNFRGDARAALEFYQSVFGGDITIVTYKDAQNVQAPSEADQVMWGQVAGKNGFRVMAYDVPFRTPWEQGKNAFFVSVRGDSAKEIAELWEKLSAGATVAQPLAPSGWTPLYGMLKDRFGVTWVLDVATEYKAS